MLDEPTAVAALTGHTDFAAAVPTPDHFIPLLYLAGLAGVAARAADVLVDGYSAGSLSMTAYTLEADCPPAAAGGGLAAALPDDLDPEDINV
jgi:4,5-DOPA dioxygenase extradiol